MELTITPEAVKADLALPSRKKKFFFYSLKAIAISILVLCVTLYSTKHFPHSYTISYDTANLVNWLVYLTVLVLVGPLSAYLTIAIHEIGHVLAGAAVGERLMLLKLGGFRIAREKQGFRVRRYGRLLPIGGGENVTAPTTVGPSRWRVSILLLGGPLCTLLQFVALWALSTHWPFHPPALWLVAILDTLYFTTLLTLFITAIPLKIIGFVTDIDQVFHLLRGGAQVERALRIHWLSGQTLLGVRPSAYQQTELDQVLNPSDGSVQERNALLLAFNKAVDLRDQVLTVALLDRVLAISMAQMDWFLYPTPLMLAACIEAKSGRGPATARAWLALLTEAQVTTFAEKSTVVELHQLRMQAWAEIYLAEHKWTEAQWAAQQSLQLLEQSINAGVMALNRRRLAEILEQTHDAPAITQLPVEQTKRTLNKRLLAQQLAKVFVLFLSIGLLVVMLNSVWTLFREVEYELLGDFHAYREEYDAAIRDYSQALQYNSRSATLYSDRAHIYFVQEDYAHSLADLNEAIKYDPTGDIAYYTGRAQSYAGLEQYEAAIKDYKYILTTELRDGQKKEAQRYLGALIYQLGLQQRDQKKYRLAIATFGESLTYDADSAWTYLNRGAAYEWLDEWDKAIVDYTAAIQYAPENIKMYTYRAYAYLHQRKYAQAIADYTKIITEEPDTDSEVYFKRGNAYFCLHRFAQAIVDMNAVIERDPQNLWAYYYRGRAYYAQQKYALANSDFRHILAAQTETDLRDLTRQALDSLQKQKPPDATPLVKGPVE